MKTIFIGDNGKVLDITKQKISVQENNSKVSDQSLSKIMFPFETMVDENFIREFGDVASYETTDLDTDIPGNLEFEGKISTAKLDIMDIEGLRLTGQIDYGLEEVPNFEKKLSELPLEKIIVEDIHIYAKQICEMRYPETNYNFPRMFTAKYSPDDSLWDAFNGYYNDLNEAGTEMLRNYVDAEGAIFNQNIIHPCPHILYLLKTGFLDAGYQLAGDILTDTNLAQRWVFSGTEYFSKQNQYSSSTSVYSLDYESSVLVRTKTIYVNGLPWYQYYSEYTYREPIPLAFSDKVYISCKFYMKIKKESEVRFLIKVAGITVWSFTQYYVSDETVEKFVSMEILVNNSEVEFIAQGCNNPSDGYEVLNYSLKSESIIPAEGETVNDTEAQVLNENMIDLSRAVPEITFGELVNTVKNWFNYDIEVKDKTIFFNKIVNVVNTEGIPFEFSEILRPKKTFLSGKSFLHRFAALDDEAKLNSMFYDKNGTLLNGKEKTDTNIIEVNGYAMPISKAKDIAPITAKVLRDSTDSLALVYYDGMTEGQNNAKNPEGCHHPELFASNWEAWLRQRIRGHQYEWSFRVPIEKLAPITIKDYVFCYNNLHIIKSWTKDKIGENTYEVQIITETVI